MPYLNDMAMLAFAISDNLAETPEGFLLAKNVKIARTGTQEYLGQELGMPELHDKVIKVYRLEEDVFNPTAMMSFEGKPVTCPHPKGGVNPDNASMYVRGHAQNIRREGIYLVADLVINDRVLINQIKNDQVRETSCGYLCEYEPYKDGFKQTNITGNHVAVVEKGRAGPRVRINDQDSVNKGANTPMDKQKLLAKMIAKCAQDASPEELVAMTALLSEDAATVAPPAPKNAEAGLFKKLFGMLAKDEESEKETKDEDEKEEKKETEDAMPAWAKEMKQTLDALVAGKKAKASTEDADFLDSIFAADGDDDDKKETEDEDEEEAKKEAADAAIQNLLIALKPTLAKLPAKDQKMAKDAIRAQIGKPAKVNQYAEIAKIVKTTQDANTSQGATDFKKLGEAIQAKNNPHYKPATSAAELLKNA